MHYLGTKVIFTGFFDQWCYFLILNKLGNGPGPPLTEAENLKVKEYRQTHPWKQLRVNSVLGKVCVHGTEHTLLREFI